MSRVLIGIAISTGCALLAGCSVGDWGADFRIFLAINAVAGGLIGAAVTFLHLPPVLTGFGLGLVGICGGVVAFGPREGGFTIVLWFFTAIWGGAVGLLTGVGIRVLRPLKGNDLS